MCFTFGKNAYSVFAYLFGSVKLCGSNRSHAFFGVWLRLESHTFYFMEDHLMTDYEKLYHIMFNAVTDAIEIMPEGDAKNLLIKAQQTCEEQYIGESKP